MSLVMFEMVILMCNNSKESFSNELALWRNVIYTRQHAYVKVFHGCQFIDEIEYHFYAPLLTTMKHFLKRN